MSSSLPDDINALKRLLAEQEALNRALLEKLNEREREIDHLQAQLDKLRRMNFGSRSEKVSRRIAQMEADLKALQKESDTLTGRVDDPAVQRPLRQTRTRKPFPESLPRDEKRLLPAASCCPECGGSLSYLGEDAAEQLELMRSVFRVIRTVREKHACTQCDAIVQAPAPSRPIERGIAGPGLLARVLISKYAEHTPLYRQSEMYGRQGVELSRSLLSGWVDACCRLLSPLEEALQDYVLTDGKLHADDTPVPVLLPGNKKTKTGRLWTYVRDDRNAGSTLALISPEGETAWQGEYDEWGNLLGETSAQQLQQPYRLPGQQYDEESGLYYNRNRYYDPLQGRYITQDPIGLRGEWNLYKYPLNPVRFIDSLGLKFHVNGDPSDFNQAVEYLKQDSQMKETIDFLSSSEETINIEYIEGTNVRFNSNNMTIYWNSRASLFCSTELNSKSQSPALGLGHGFAHAQYYLLDKENFIALLSRTDKKYENKEEARVITIIESRAAKTLGECTRGAHSGLPFYRVDGPLQTMKITGTPE
ncbi:TPA: IS66 family transposase [Escherichia coli]|nr:IS66 family transposase [Escherichia coli]